MLEAIDLVQANRPLFIDDAGQPCPERAWRADQPMAVLPGSFNPVHEGHWNLARAGGKWLRLPVSFELSLANVDKPSLNLADVKIRLAPFRHRSGVWLTRAPRFLDKARLFPGATFIVGVDTAERILKPAYYGGCDLALTNALRSVRDQGCRCLVAGRLNSQGCFLQLADLKVPSEFQELFTPLPPDTFRLDLSSTQLRRLKPGQPE